ncbi:unnamed protein product [Allacma fusca]|uniref:Uncharacterized protein n=1 Tax=Allacma fusca TaxID=39272 RepID=A0A8J2LRQ8_9HEXA|nr:unnamed protein product [Allacma fusca]
MSVTNSTVSESQELSLTSEKFRLIAEQYNNIDAWMYAFPTPLAFFKFFQSKLDCITNQYSKVLELANQVKLYAERGLRNETDRNQLHKRIYTLEENLGKVQTCLYDERENYVKIVTDNELLKLENEDYRRKFQSVLLMSKIDERDVSLFMQKNPKAAVLTDRMIEIKDDIRKCVGPKKSQYELLNPVVLTKQVRVLEDHIKRLGEVQHEKEFALKEHLRLVEEEKAQMIESYETRLANSVDRSSELKDLVHSLVLENVTMGKKIISAEQDWLLERDKLLKVAAHTHFETLEPTTISNCLTKRRVSDDSEAVKRLTQKLGLLENKLMEKDNLIEEYKFKVLRMEKQTFQLQEIGDELKKIHKDDVRKLIDRNKAIEKRCEEIDSRRKLDNAGFREDVKALKNLLSSLERKFRLCEKKKSPGMHVNVPQKHLNAPSATERAVTAPGNYAGNVGVKSEVESEAEVKEVLTWEALNCLLAIAVLCDSSLISL